MQRVTTRNLILAGSIAVAVLLVAAVAFASNVPGSVAVAGSSDLAGVLPHGYEQTPSLPTVSAQHHAPAHVCDPTATESTPIDVRLGRSFGTAGSGDGGGRSDCAPGSVAHLFRSVVGHPSPSLARLHIRLQI